MCLGVGFDPTVSDVGICGIKVCISTADFFAYMTIYDLEIQLVLFQCFEIVFPIFFIFS